MLLNNSKKIAPNAFEYRLNLHKKTSALRICSNQTIQAFIALSKLIVHSYWGDSSMLDTNSEASFISLQNLHVPK
jgi:hypothetical protein